MKAWRIAILNRSRPKWFHYQIRIFEGSRLLTPFLWHYSHEMYIYPLNLCSEMTELIQYRFLFSPVEFCQPMVTNSFHIFRLESVFKIAIFQIAAKTGCLKSPLEVLNACIRDLDGHGFYGDVISFLFSGSPPLRLVVNRFQCRGHQENAGNADGDQDGNESYQFPTHSVVLMETKTEWSELSVL